MATPQPGIFALGNRSYHHLQLDLRPGAEVDQVCQALTRIGEQITTTLGVSVVFGMAADVWARVAPDSVPPGLERFGRRAGPDGVAMEARQHDLWFFLQSGGPDSVFDAARLVATEMREVATVAEEWPCFTYRTGLDFTGFEDGTENPPLPALGEVVSVPAGIPGEGGSVVLLQRWVHNLDAFSALPPGEQEQVVGRTLHTSDELPDAVRSPCAHVSRVVIEDAGGTELKVFRRSAAFGGVLEHGLIFLAFSADVDRLSRMLDRMLGADDGLRDRLTDFSRAVASAWYYAPPLETLSRR